jgi:hypothetical protein
MRIYISNTEIPRMNFPSDYKYCEETIVDYYKIEDMAGRGLWLVTQTRLAGVIMYIMSTPKCIDCTMAGTNVKPDFWY